MNDITTYPCPCCAYLTLSEPAQGTFEICPVCFWEDDYVQLKDPDYTGGANVVSLNQAKANFQTFGASEEKFIRNVRPPRPEEIPKQDSARKLQGLYQTLCKTMLPSFSGKADLDNWLEDLILLDTQVAGLACSAVSGARIPRKDIPEVTTLNNRLNQMENAHPEDVQIIDQYRKYFNLLVQIIIYLHALS